MSHISQLLMNRLPGLFVALAIVTLSTLSMAEEKTRAPKDSDGALQWKFKMGQTLNLNMEQKQKLSMNIGGQDIVTDTTSITEMVMNVVEVDNDGIASATNTIKRMKIVTEAPAMKIEYDSADDEKQDGIAGQIADIISPMVGAEIKQKMRPSGKVFEVQVPEKMLEGAKDANPMMASMFSKETFEDMTSKASLEFPQSKMEVGKTWNVTADMKMGPAVVRTDTDYKYLGVADIDGTPLHLIQGKIKMSFPDGITGADVEVSDEDSTVIFYFDGNRGRLIKSVLDQDLTMLIKAGGQNIKQRLEQEMTVKLTDAE